MSNVCSTLTVEVEPHLGATIENKELNLIAPPKVLVNFRPHNNYKGEFGFDWLRMGDTGREGDVWYRNIVGSYATRSFIQNTAEYTRLIQRYDLLAHPVKKNDFYAVPVLALLPNKTARFSLKIEVEIEAKKIEFKYDNNFFRLNQTEVSYKTKGSKTLPDYLEIECIKEFRINQYIEVLADGTFAGKLKVLANDKLHRYQANIVFVEVETELATGSIKKGNSSGEEALIKKYLNQTLTKPNIVTKELNLTADSTLNTTYKLIRGANAQINAISGIHAYLETKFAAVHPGYTSYFKVFFFNERGGRMLSSGNYRGLNGGARAIVSKSVVLYNTHNSSTTTHEILHAMGLHHTFSDNGQFTLKKGETENIMDYSHQSQYGSKNRISTWEWQWETIHPNLIKET